MINLLLPDDHNREGGFDLIGHRSITDAPLISAASPEHTKRYG